MNLNKRQVVKMGNRRVYNQSCILLSEFHTISTVSILYNLIYLNSRLAAETLSCEFDEIGAHAGTLSLLV